MEYRGYVGKILHIDLSSGESEHRPLDPEMGRSFIGGFGLNARLAYDFTTPGADALSPRTPLVLGAGPLIGTMAPGSARVVATTKFPLSNSYGGGSGSLGFGLMMKRSGFDRIIITGRAQEPVDLLVENGEASIRGAKDLWGKDIYDTTEALRARHGQCGVAAIGQAGEKLVLLSLVMVDFATTMGRGGLGASFGAKNLKAIVVKGDAGVEISDIGRFNKAVKGMYDRVKRYPLHRPTLELGLLAHSGEDPEDPSPFGIKAYRKVKKERLACPSCFISDKDCFRIDEGPFAGTVVYSHAFSPVRRMGAVFRLDDTAQGVVLAGMLNRHGLGNHEFIRMVEFMFDLKERGLLSDELMRELPLQRDFESGRALIELLTQREGFGDVMARGMLSVIDEVGGEAGRYAHQVKGMGTLMDPRSSSLGTMEFEQLVNVRGGHHQAGGSPAYSPGTPVDKFPTHAARMGAAPDFVDRIMDSPLGFSVPRLTKLAEDWFSLLNSLGICVRAHNNRFYSARLCAELYSAATGMEADEREVMTAAERGWNMYRILNVREGMGRDDDSPPQVWFEPLEVEGQTRRLMDYYRTKTLTREDVEAMLNDYYEERGWDPSTGAPTPDKLDSLGLAWALK
jgi:aldehyde:ferredoxin oxidoreductase